MKLGSTSVLCAKLLMCFRNKTGIRLSTGKLYKLSTSPAHNLSYSLLIKSSIEDWTIPSTGSVTAVFSVLISPISTWKVPGINCLALGLYLRILASVSAISLISTRNLFTSASNSKKVPSKLVAYPLTTRFLPEIPNNSSNSGSFMDISKSYSSIETDLGYTLALSSLRPSSLLAAFSIGEAIDMSEKFSSIF
jgi:hypothetical protein